MDLRLNTNSTCNLDCAHCYYKSKVGFDGATMDLNEAKRILKEAESIYGETLNVILMGGGEPFLFAGLEELMRYSVDQLGIIPSLTTNAQLLDDQKLLMVGSFGSMLHISVEGTQEFNDAIRGTGTFRKALAATIRAKRSGVRFSINFTLCKENIQQIPYLMKLFSENAEYITFSRYVPYLKSEHQTPLDSADYLVIERILGKYRDSKLRFRQERFFRREEAPVSDRFDHRKLKSLYVLPDLRAYPAWNLLDYPLGSLADQSLLEILTNGKLEKLYDPENLAGKYCRNCRYKYNCIGDRGVARFYTGDFWGDDIQCPYFSSQEGRIDG